MLFIKLEIIQWMITHCTKGRTQTNRRVCPLINKADDQTQKADQQSSNQTVPSFRLDRWKLTKFRSFRSQQFVQTMDKGTGWWGEGKKGQSGTKGWAGATGSRPATEQTGYLWLQLMVSTCICSCQTANALKPAGRIHIYLSPAYLDEYTYCFIVQLLFFNIVRD